MGTAGGEQGAFPDRGLSAGEVARRLGVAATTVRTWDRRYGLGPARRDPGHHRRYDEQDVARVSLMARLVRDGVSTAEAARVASSSPAALAIPAPSPALPTDTAAARGLRRAALALDGPGLDRLLAGALAAGVVPAWTSVICPALRHIGRRHVATGRQIDAEHLLSRAVSVALSGVARPAGRADILLACAPEEQHTLALEALAAALAEEGRASLLLGARVPGRALGDAVARTGPAAVVVWAHSSGTADANQLDAALSARPRPTLVMAAGPGWARLSAPPGVVVPEDLHGALSSLSAYH